MIRELPTTCIVGDGYPGALAIRALRARGLPFECFRVTPAPHSAGGFGGTGALASEYFQRLTRHNGSPGLSPPQQGVRVARRTDSGAWGVQLEDGETRFYDALVVTAQPQLLPRLPAIEGARRFTGLSLHSCAYPGPEPFRNSVVLVIGGGRHATKIAAGLVDVARLVLVSPPPSDETMRLSQPGKLARCLSLWAQAEPGERPLRALSRRRLRVVEEAVAFEGRTARFADGRTREVDVVVYCTGFSPRFVFLDPALESAGGREFELYKRVFRPSLDNLFFVGAFLPEDTTSQAVSLQAHLVAEYLSGAYALPDLFTMRNQPHYDRGRAAARLFDPVQARRGHALDTYAVELSRELERGRRRALRGGQRCPLPAIAGEFRPPTRPQKSSDSDPRVPLSQAGQEPRGPKGDQAAASIAAA